MMKEISLLVIAYNEEKNLDRCLTSAKGLVDEIVVVDSFSTDRTCEIAAQYSARIILHSYENYLAQKNFALTQASFDRVLSLDADEYLSPELAKAILEIKQKWPYDGYKINRLSSYGSKWIRHGSWYPNTTIRLWDRRKGIWGGNILHEHVVMEKGARISPTLPGDILHLSYQSHDDVTKKVQHYSSMSASIMLDQGRRISVPMILLKTCAAFFKSYVLKRGFLDGYEGLVAAFISTAHTAAKYAKLYEAVCRQDLDKKAAVDKNGAA